MKYKDFIEIAENNSYKITDYDDFIAASKPHFNEITIFKTKRKEVFINNILCELGDFEVIEASIKLANTKLEDRGK